MHRSNLCIDIVIFFCGSCFLVVCLAIFPFFVGLCTREQYPVWVQTVLPSSAIADDATVYWTEVGFRSLVWLYIVWHELHFVVGPLQRHGLVHHPLFS